MKKALLLISFIILYSPIYSINKAKLDSLFDIVEQNSKAMGSLSIYKDGKEVYSKSIGFENIDKGVKATSKTEYRIGSISKTFTAAIIMRILEDKKLTLDTKLSKYYPDAYNADKITIRHLLKHRSGIFNFTEDTSYFDWMEKPITSKKLEKIIVSYPSVFEPDSKAEYSNSNYLLLSFIAEKILKKDFAKILEEQITKPCKLDNTYYGGAIGSKGNEAQSYFYDGDWVQATETDMSVPIGAGAIVSTTSDLNKYLYCLFNGNIIDDYSMAIMMDIEDGYGAGLFKVPFKDKSAYGHTGKIDGFESSAFYFPKERVSITYLSNGVVIPLNNIVIGALKIYFGDEYEIPTFQPTIIVSKDILQQYVGVYSNPAIPIKINIFIEGDDLFGQATGQAEFKLEAYEKDKFKFEPAMLSIEFNPAESEFVIIQGGGEMKMKKETESK